MGSGGTPLMMEALQRLKAMEPAKPKRKRKVDPIVLMKRALREGVPCSIQQMPDGTVILTTASTDAGLPPAKETADDLRRLI